MPRNFQVFDALDFLAELTQHIPDKGEHLVRYFGWYSHRCRGLRSVRDGSSEVTVERRLLEACDVQLVLDLELTAELATDGAFPTGGHLVLDPDYLAERDGESGTQQQVVPYD